MEAPETAAVSPSEVGKGKPVRGKLTMVWATHQRILERSGYEGRSLSNLGALLLEPRLKAPARSKQLCYGDLLQSKEHLPQCGQLLAIVDRVNKFNLLSIHGLHSYSLLARCH